ncbi:MAG: hypothetical protein J1E34_07050 [Oscillospiraceae bacterium]|nr:hypothetical protein [Oscillospiraceae bacterium]
MDESIVPFSENNANLSENEGISFSGGKENAFIKEYAASPQSERTIEQIEEEEMRMAEKQAQLSERASRRREEIKNKKASSSALIKSLETEKTEKSVPEASVNSFSEKGPSVKEPKKSEVTKKLSRAELLIPVSSEAGFAPEENEDLPEGKKQLSRFARVFSESAAFSVFSLITGIALIAWNILYIVTAVIRDILFTNAANAMAIQGQLNYTAVFSSPALTVLKISAYFLMVLVLAWGIFFRVTDGKYKSYNKKTVIIIMCLIAFAAVVAVFDVAFAHLVMA